MNTLAGWLNRPCCCVHPDAHECAAIRDGRRYSRPDPGCRYGRVWVDRDLDCDCPCHEIGDDDE